MYIIYIYIYDIAHFNWLENFQKLKFVKRKEGYF